MIENLLAGLRPIVEDHVWVVFLASAVYIFKDSISNMAEGFLFKFTSAFKEDDIIFINGKPARIQRIGMRATVFYMLDSFPRKKYIVPNERIKFLQIEKELDVSRESQWKRSDEQLKVLEERLVAEIVELKKYIPKRVDDKKIPPT
jgi:hypothetical protein